MATSAQKRAAATTAMQKLAKTSPALANRIVDDFINAGFTYSASVRNDVDQAYLLNPGIGATLRAFFTDPVAVRQEGQNVIAQVGQPIGTAVDNTATATAAVGKGVAAATGAALSTNPIGALFQAHIWIRVGEVALGLILIAVGVAKLTNAVPIATKIARHVT